MSSAQTPRAKGAGTARWLALLAGLGAGIALVVRYDAVAHAAATYNEAVYIDLARHPWRSAYYPDTLFVRHPPLYFFVLNAWHAVVGEQAHRLPGLLFSMAGTALCMDAARRRAGWGAAALTAITLGASWSIWAYSIQATMYPLAFLFVALGVHAYIRHDAATERTAWTLVALTHLFGFVFIVGRILQAPHTWRRELAWTAPAWLWLLAAGPAGMINRGNGIIALGPVGQGVRAFATAAEWFTEMAFVHVAALVLVGFSLAPWLWPAWRDRRLWPGLALPSIVLAAYLLVGAPFARYGLFLLPVVTVAGTCAVTQLHSRGAIAVGIVIALASVPVGLAVVHAGPDPRDEAEVPGILHWDEAAVHVAGRDVATSAPPALAMALEPLGWRVTEASQGPYLLALSNGTHTMQITRVDWPREAAAHPWALVPENWDLPACDTVGGLAVVGPCPTER